MNSCVEYINKYNYLKRMIRISDKKFNMNLNNHSLRMMFQIEKSRFEDQLKELKKKDLFNQCIN